MHGTNGLALVLAAVVVLVTGAGVAGPQELGSGTGPTGCLRGVPDPRSHVDTRCLSIGSVTSQGDAKMNGPAARAAFVALRTRL